MNNLKVHFLEISIECSKATNKDLISVRRKTHRISECNDFNKGLTISTRHRIKNKFKGWITLILIRIRLSTNMSSFSNNNLKINRSFSKRNNIMNSSNKSISRRKTRICRLLGAEQTITKTKCQFKIWVTKIAENSNIFKRAIISFRKILLT